jgi:KaiC domain protein
MSEDGDGETDDWFERALRETDAEDAEETDAEDADGEETDAADETAEPTGTESDDSPFEEDFASAFENAPDVDDGAASGGDQSSPFEEDFASAFENAPDFGGEVPGGGSGGGAPPGGEDQLPDLFGDDDAEFDSAIDRIDIGIEGLDNMILGGIPKRSLISIVGSAGTGKTTFGLQFLEEALSNGDRGIYLTLEESSDRIYDTAEEKGWTFGEYADEGRLAVVHLDPIEMANSLGNIRNELPELIEEFGADRLVLDSVSLLEMMYDQPSERRSEVYQFSKSLKEAGVTTLVTSEASSETPYSSRYGIIEYLADAVFVLQYVRSSDFRETRLAVEIQKIRDANHSRETKPYEITDEGLSVYRQANIF